MPQFRYLEFIKSLLEIRINYSHNLKISAGHTDSNVRVNRVALIYSNSEMVPWLKLIPSRLGKTTASGSNQPSRQTPLTLTVDAWDLSAVALFQDALPLRSGLTHMQLQLVDHPATGISSVEFQTETLWCCLGNRTPSDPGQKKVHYWNSPLHVGLVIGKIERQLGILNMRDTIKSQLLLDVLRFEWSPNLMDTIITIQK